MKLSTVLTPVVLVAGLAFSGVAFADTMVAGQNVSDADLPKVQVQCDALATAAGTEGTTDGEAQPMDNGTPEASTNDASDGAVEVDGAAAATSAFDLTILTAENCKEAGLIK